MLLIIDIFNVLGYHGYLLSIIRIYFSRILDYVRLYSNKPIKPIFGDSYPEWTINSRHKHQFFYIVLDLELSVPNWFFQEEVIVIFSICHLEPFS